MSKLKGREREAATNVYALSSPEIEDDTCGSLLRDSLIVVLISSSIISLLAYTEPAIEYRTDPLSDTSYSEFFIEPLSETPNIDCLIADPATDAA